MSGSETPTSIRSYSSFRSQSSFRRYRTSDVNFRSGNRNYSTADQITVLPSPANATAITTCNHLSLSEHHPLHVSRKTSPEPSTTMSMVPVPSAAQEGRSNSERSMNKEHQQQKQQQQSSPSCII